jgi:hypothetical protein
MKNGMMLNNYISRGHGAHGGLMTHLSFLRMQESLLNTLQVHEIPALRTITALIHVHKFTCA